MLLFWVLLVLGVALIGGSIAWLGDSVGRRVGRKHLRLFGLRPKTTGLVVAISSGVLVALATVGTVSLLARSTVDNALKAPEMRLELEQLKGSIKNINNEYQSSKNKLMKMLDQSQLEQQEFERIRNELQARQDELSATTALNGRLDARILGLETERNTLGTQIKSKTAELQRLGLESSQRIDTLRKELKTLETQRSESTNQIQRLNTQRNQLQSRIKTLATERTELENKVATAQTATNQALAQQRSLETTVNNLETNVSNLEAGRKKLEAQQSQLEAQRNQLQSESNQLKTERNQLSASVGQLENQSAQLKNQSDVLRNERSKLESDIRELNQTRTSLEASVNRLETQNTALTQQLNRAESELRDAQEALAQATSGNFIYRQGDLVAQLVLESNSAETLRDQLQKWLKQASQIAQGRGATRNKAVVLKPSADLDPYIALAQKSKGADLVLMRTSRSVTQTGLELPVTLEVKSNDVLFSSGQPLRSREISLGTGNKPNSSWRVAFENLVRETERDLIERGVPKENIPATLVSSAELTAFIAQLESLSGTVWIAVAARRDITPAGPVQVYLSLMR